MGCHVSNRLLNAWSSLPSPSLMGGKDKIFLLIYIQPTTTFCLEFRHCLMLLNYLWGDKKMPRKTHKRAPSVFLYFSVFHQFTARHFHSLQSSYLFLSAECHFFTFIDRELHEIDKNSNQPQQKQNKAEQNTLWHFVCLFLISENANTKHLRCSIRKISLLAIFTFDTFLYIYPESWHYYQEWDGKVKRTDKPKNRGDHTWFLQH